MPGLSLMLTLNSILRVHQCIKSKACLCTLTLLFYNVKRCLHAANMDIERPFHLGSSLAPQFLPSKQRNSEQYLHVLLLLPMLQSPEAEGDDHQDRS